MTLMARSPFKIWPTLRDAVIIFALQILGGVIADAATNGKDLDPSTVLTIVYLTKFLFGGIGFAISGCLAVGNRWHHLAYVACVVFGFGIGWEGVSLQHCVGVAALAFVNMLIGGGISFMIKSDSRMAEPTTAPPLLAPIKPAMNAPAKSKARLIVAAVIVVIIVWATAANLVSDSTSTTKPDPNSNGGQAGGTASGYTPPLVNTPPVCKALDEKNGFKDFKFGMTTEEARGVLSPSFVATNGGPNNTIFLYDNTPANRIGDFPFAVLRLCFYEDRLYRIELHFDKFQNEILEAFKANFGEPFATDSWKMGDQPVQGKAWQGNKVYAAFLSSPSTRSSSAIIYDIAANEKATDYAAKEPERAAKDFGTNGFKTLVMGMKIEDLTPSFTIVDDNQVTGVKKVVFTRDAYWIYWQNIGYYPLTSVSAEFFHDELYRIDLAFSQNQNEIFETFKQRFGPSQDNDTWTRDSMKLKGKSAGGGKLSATILAPEVADGGGDGWDSIVLLDVALSRAAEQFKDDAPKRAAKDF